MEVRFIRKNGKVIPIRTNNSNGLSSKSQNKHTLKQKKKGFSKTNTIAIVGGLSTYLLARKIRIPTKLPHLKRLQDVVRKSGGLGVAHSKPGAAGNWVADGISRVVLGLPFDSKKLVGKVVLQRQAGISKSFRASHTINPDHMMWKVGYKNEVFRAGVIKRSSMPRTMTLSKAMKQVKGKKENLKTIYPKYLLKKPIMAMSKVKDFINEKNVMTKKAKSFFKRGTIIQEKLKLTGEYRAHYLNGKVFGISHRYASKPVEKAWRKLTGSQGGAAFIPVINPAKRREIKKFVESSVNLKQLGKKESLFVAFDIGQTKQGIKIIEGNLTMGTIANPLVSRKFKELASGQMSKVKAALLGVGAYLGLKKGRK